jgi:hypothetical protein
MSKPKFEFTANSAAPDDESGVAVWRYTEERRTGDVEVVVRQDFPSFRAAYAMDGLLAVAWADGEAEGYANCERKVLGALRA